MPEESKGILQSIIVDKRIIGSKARAIRLAMRYGSAKGVFETRNTWRFRQSQPNRKLDYTSIKPENGVTLVWMIE